MASPTCGPLSMLDIATAFSQASSNMSLYTFGSTLPTPTVTSNIELANDFYGQSSVTLTAFSYNSEGQEGGAGEACSLESTEDTAYHNGSGTYPDVDDVVYSNSAGSSTLAASTYKYDNGGQKGGFIDVNEDGEVANLGNCK